MNVLEVENVSKRFGNLVAVSGVSLRVPKGELRAIIGPNGAGKTTFFNLDQRLLPAEHGKDRLRWADITMIPAHRRVELGMARTFQVTEIFPELRCSRTCASRPRSPTAIGLRPWMTLSREDDGFSRLVDETLPARGLEAKAARLVGELAHGDQRAAEVAMALSLRPRLLLLDEPTRRDGRPGDL